MCLIVKGNIKIAKKDRIVYKIFYEYDRTLTSLYRGMKYIIGRVYKIKAIKILMVNPYDKSEKRINRGYHAYTTLSMAKKKDLSYLNNTITIYRAIIPAGSQYAIDDNNEIVSNQIVIKDKVPKTR